MHRRWQAVHRCGIHEPSHSLRIGVHIGGGDVSLGPDERVYHGSVSLRYLLELTGTEFPWIASDPSLCSPVWNIRDSALQGHQGCKGLDLIDIRCRMISDTSLAWPSGRIVLNPVTSEYVYLTIIHDNRYLDSEFPLRLFDHLGDARIDTDPLDGRIYLILNAFIESLNHGDTPLEMQESLVIYNFHRQYEGHSSSRGPPFLVNAETEK